MKAQTVETSLRFKPFPTEGQAIMLKLFILFSLVPILELYLIVTVGNLLGIVPTILLLLAISSAGAWLVRHQGFSLIGRIQGELAVGRVPGGALLEGALVLAGGVLLLTPGFFTDFLGLFFLAPPSRALIARLVVRWLHRQLQNGRITVRRM